MPCRMRSCPVCAKIAATTLRQLISYQCKKTARATVELPIAANAIVYKQRGIWRDRYYQVFNNRTGEVIKDYRQKRIANAVSENLNQAKN